MFRVLLLERGLLPGVAFAPELSWEKFRDIVAAIAAYRLLAHELSWD